MDWIQRWKIRVRDSLKMFFYFLNLCPDMENIMHGLNGRRIFLFYYDLIVSVLFKQEYNY